MTIWQRTVCLLLGVQVSLAVSPALAQERTNVAVFNFQMKSRTPEWAWLEKGLADQITTCLAADGKLMVLARDEMQAVAQKVRWAPELAAADPRLLEEIQKQLKIEYLVTGLYSVDGQRIRLTGQVIEMETRKEQARKEVSGESADILELQRRLASELLAWFGRKPAEQVMERLPVWTKSVPAAQALYEGMDLYDQGRYEEAWLKFRQAARNDAGYLEAQYWVGKMYYFLDRYEHARRSYERFVYGAGNHPRMGDAIEEFVHTYEKTGASPETLMDLYAGLRSRSAGIRIHSPTDTAALTADAWLRVRSSQLLAARGRYPEAIDAASGVLREAYARAGRGTWSFGVWDGWSAHAARSAARTYNALMGKVHMPEGVLNRFTDQYDPGVLRFTPRQTDVQVARQRGLGVRRGLMDGRIRYDVMHAPYVLLVPEGYSLKRLTLYPDVRGTDAKIFCWLEQDTHLDIPAQKHRPVAEAATEGLVIDNIPWGNIFNLVFYMTPNDGWRDPQAYFRGFRAVAELEKIESHGSIRLTCPNASAFFVDLDGRRARKRGGLIGPVPPGRHVLEFRYRDWGTVYAPHRAEVNVEANRTTDIEVVLPWKPEGPLEGWSSGSLIRAGSLPAGPCLQDVTDRPCIQADQGAVRVFWSHGGDLWCTASTDGNSFPPAHRLPMPVSSGWIEQSPLCLRDESGRFLLAFASDRDAQHRMRPYVCWSRDAMAWSRPAAVSDRSVNHFDMIQDDGGRFVWVDATDRKLTVMTSRDAYRWEPAARWDLPGPEKAVRILQRGDGSYELFVVDLEPRVGTLGGPGSTHSRVAYRYRSKDAADWSPAEEIRPFRGQGEMSVSAMQVAGRTHVAFFEDDLYAGFWPFIIWIRENDLGAWDSSAGLDGIGSYYAAAAYHPRWGYLICWRHPLNIAGTLPEAGPFLVRGPSVARFFPPPGTSAASRPTTASQPAVR